MPLAPLVAALAVAIASQDADASGPLADARLLGFDQLEARLGDPDLRILDARPLAEYDAGHIPGAVWVDTAAVGDHASRPGALEDPERWGPWASSLGIAPGTSVYIYDASRQREAARLWWLLGYLGVDDVGLIDGGFPLWREEGRPVSTDVPLIEPRPFNVRLRDDRHATRDEVLAASQGGEARVVDARSAGEFFGEQVRSKKGGHVPTACHLEWSTLVDEHGRFLPESSLRPRLDAVGLRPGRPAITHCQGGGRASVDAFVLRRLGIPAQNYYLGWSDWGNAPDTPVSTGDDAPPQP